MESIKNIDSIKVTNNGNEITFVPEEITDAKSSPNRERLILNILVDISSSMAPRLQTVNEQLNIFIKSIYNTRSDVEKILDICVTTFGDSTVKIIRPFGLISEDDIDSFHLKKFDGTTPLGSAMLLAYKHCFDRKTQYDKEETGLTALYRPIIVIISDFHDYDPLVAAVDGIEYGKEKKHSGKIYSEVAELFSKLQDDLIKEITVLPIATDGTVNYNKELFGKLNPKEKYAYTPETGPFGIVLGNIFNALFASMKKMIRIREEDTDDTGLTYEQIQEKKMKNLDDILDNALKDI